MAATKKENTKKVPGALVVAVVVIIAIAAFVPTVYMPYKNKKPGMDEKHQEALDTIAYLDESIADQPNIEADIADLTAQWEKYQKDMFVDAQSALADLNKAILDCNWTLINYNAGEAAADPSGTVTADGNPLYFYAITIDGLATREDMLKFLKYVEEDSIGAYYVKTLNANPEVIVDSDSEVHDDQLRINTQIYLYYFNQNVVIPQQLEVETDSAA